MKLNRSVEHNRRVQRVYKNYLKGMSVTDLADDECEEEHVITRWIKEAQEKKLETLRRDRSAEILTDDLARIDLAKGLVMTRLEGRDTSESDDPDPLGTTNESTAALVNALAKLVDLELDILGLRNPPEGQHNQPALMVASTNGQDDPDGWSGQLQTMVERQIEIQRKLGILEAPPPPPEDPDETEIILDVRGVEPPSPAVSVPPPPPLDGSRAFAGQNRSKF